MVPSPLENVLSGRSESVLVDAFCIGRSGGTDERLHMGRSFVGERTSAAGAAEGSTEMKHYAKLKGDEIDLIECRRWVSPKADTAGAKRGYRRRERAVLKEMLRSEVAEFDGDCAYWERELKSAIAEFADLRDAEFNEKWFHATYGVGYDSEWYEEMHSLYIERITAAEKELAALAA